MVAETVKNQGGLKFFLALTKMLRHARTIMFPGAVRLYDIPLRSCSFAGYLLAILLPFPATAFDTTRLDQLLSAARNAHSAQATVPITTPSPESFAVTKDSVPPPPPSPVSTAQLQCVSLGELRPEQEALLETISASTAAFAPLHSEIDTLKATVQAGTGLSGCSDSVLADLADFSARLGAFDLGSLLDQSTKVGICLQDIQMRVGADRRSDQASGQSERAQNLGRTFDDLTMRDAALIAATERLREELYAQSRFVRQVTSLERGCVSLEDDY